jgi:hypothetical protein
VLYCAIMFMSTACGESPVLAGGIMGGGAVDSTCCGEETAGGEEAVGTGERDKSGATRSSKSSKSKHSVSSEAEGDVLAFLPVRASGCADLTAAGSKGLSGVTELNTVDDAVVGPLR